jgi:hypothetical protein
MAIETTNAPALVAAGFSKVRNVTGRVELWSGSDAGGSSIMKLFDPTTGFVRVVSGEAIDGVAVSAAIGGLALTILALLAEPSFSLAADKRAAYSAAILDAIG